MPYKFRCWHFLLLTKEVTQKACNKVKTKLSCRKKNYLHNNTETVSKSKNDGKRNCNNFFTWKLFFDVCLMLRVFFFSSSHLSLFVRAIEDGGGERLKCLNESIVTVQANYKWFQLEIMCFNARNSFVGMIAFFRSFLFFHSKFCLFIKRVGR